MLASLGAREGFEVCFGGLWSGEADEDEAEQRGDEGGEDGVAVGEDGREVRVNECGVPKDGYECTGEDASHGG